MFLFTNQNQQNPQFAGSAPHKCSQVDSYNLPPTIFNTLMFGIDQNKVSSHVKESFTKINSSQNKTPQKHHLEEEKVMRKKSSRGNLRENTYGQANEYYAKGTQPHAPQQQQASQTQGAGGINNFVTKVDKFANPVPQPRQSAR